jgi:hypothetical protein
MVPFFASVLTCFSAFFRSRYNLGLEILTLRQQLGVLKRKDPRPRLRIQDRMFWNLLCCLECWILSARKRWERCTSRWYSQAAVRLLDLHSESVRLPLI